METAANPHKGTKKDFVKNIRLSSAGVRRLSVFAYHLGLLDGPAAFLGVTMVLPSAPYPPSIVHDLFAVAARGPPQ